MTDQQGRTGPAPEGSEPVEVDAELLAVGTIRLAEGVLCEVLDGEAVLYNPADGSLHLLDPVATAIWNVIDTRAGTRLTPLTEQLAAQFSAQPEAVHGDVVTFLTRLVGSGLLELSAPA